MATAHLIHGHIGAGKTTFARRLEKELPAIRFSDDEWMAHLYGDDPPVAEFAQLHQRVSALIDQHWIRCLELGLDVVLDLGFWSRHQRDCTRAIARNLGADTLLYRLACPDDEAWRRIEMRNQRLDGNLLIVRNTFETLKSRFEPLGDDEERIEMKALPRPT